MWPRGHVSSFQTRKAQQNVLLHSARGVPSSSKTYALRNNRRTASNVVLRLKLGMGAQFHVCWANKAGELGYVESGSYAESEIDMSGLDVSLANCYFAHHS